MHNYVDYRWFKIVLSKFISILLIYSIFFTTTANAGAAEKWEIVEKVYDSSKKTVEVTAKKVTANAANDPNYKVRVPVSASDLGKTVKGMLWLSVASVAVSSLVDAVGWVIDEGSQVIKKPIEPDVPNSPLLYKNTNGQSNLTWHADPDSACKQYSGSSSYNFRYVGYRQSDRGCLYQSQPKSPADSPWSETKFQFGYITKPNPDYVPNKDPEYEPVSDDELGTLILGESSEPNAPTQPQTDIITDAYDVNNPASDTPAPKAVGDALDNANPEPANDPKGDSSKKPNEDTDGDGVPDTYNPELPDVGTEFSLPSFCEWAVSVCEFFKVQKQDNNDIKENQKEQIKQDSTFFESVKDWFDWTKEDDDLNDDSEDPEIKEIELPDLSTNTFSSTAGCPQPILVPVSFSKNGSIEVSYEPICQLAEKWSFVAPLIGFISGAMILIGVGRKGEDGEI